MLSAASSFQIEADATLDRLRADGSSNVVNTSRRSSMQLVMTAVGGFSMLEGILEQSMGWPKPFQELEQRLRDAGYVETSDRFNTFRLAINVLKHGSGESYDRLRKRNDLPFRIKLPGENFFDEGDISEIPGLVLVDMQFVHACAIAIEDAFTCLEIPSIDV
jgi:hypothetical protein